MPRYLEDFKTGDSYESPAFTVTEADSLRFANEFDPQPFHLDREAAKTSAFGDLAASGWHTAAVTMRGIVASGMEPGWGYLGAGVEEMRWPRPTFPGDALHVRIEVLETKPSRSKPDRGMVRMQVDTLNGDGKPVQQMIVNMLVPTRPNGAA